MEGMKNAVAYVMGMVREGQLNPYQTRVMLVDVCCDYGARAVWEHIKSAHADVYRWLNPPAFDDWMTTFPDWEAPDPEPEPDLPLLPDNHFDFLDVAI